jgi:hypothetical protein
MYNQEYCQLLIKSLLSWALNMVAFMMNITLAPDRHTYTAGLRQHLMGFRPGECHVAMHGAMCT